jgi:hypothetical protein
MGFALATCDSFKEILQLASLKWPAPHVAVLELLCACFVSVLVADGTASVARRNTFACRLLPPDSSCRVYLHTKRMVPLGARRLRRPSRQERELLAADNHAWDAAAGPAWKDQCVMPQPRRTTLCHAAIETDNISHLYTGRVLRSKVSFPHGENPV